MVKMRASRVISLGAEPGRVVFQISEMAHGEAAARYFPPLADMVSAAMRSATAFWNTAAWRKSPKTQHSISFIHRALSQDFSVIPGAAGMFSQRLGAFCKFPE
jgi:hypothetical protein